MPPVYTYDHIHLRTKNPQATIEYYQKMFDATPVTYVQSNGKPRVDLDLNGLTIFIAEVPADASSVRHQGTLPSADQRNSRATVLALQIWTPTTKGGYHVCSRC